MKYRAGFESIQAAQVAHEKKLAQAKNRLTNKPAGSQEANKQKVEKPKSQSAQTRFPPKPRVSPLPFPPSPRAAMPRIHRDCDRKQVIPSDALIELLGLYRHAAVQRSRHIAMCWPGAPAHFGLIHALATMQSQADGDKLGIRGTLFPCKQNVFYALNHLEWSTGDVLDLVRRNAEVGRGKNPWVLRGYVDKDPFLFSVTELEKDPGLDMHPALGDLLPRYYSGTVYDGWHDCSHQLLGNILAKVRRRQVSRALRRTASQAMGQPGRAPDALFAIDGRLKNDELNLALRDLYSHEIPPDVVLIGWPVKARLDYPRWRAMTKRMVKLIDKVCGDNPPGIICVTDDPRASFELRDSLYETAKETGTSPFSLHAVANRVGGDGLVIGQTPFDQTRPITFDLQVVDTDADRLCRTVYRVARDNGQATLENNPLADIIGLVSRVSALPCGLRDLHEQMREGEVSDRTSRMYQWLNVKASVLEHLKAAPLEKECSTFQSAMDNVHALMGRAHDATNFAIRLANLVAHTTDTGNTTVLLVFASAFRRQLARRFLSRYEDYPQGVSYADIEPRLYFIMTGDLEHALRREPRARVVFVGLNEEATRIVMSSNAIPNRTTILNTHRSALFLRGSLHLILKYFEDTFRPLKTRIESLIQQTPDGNDRCDLMPQPSVKMPDLRIELSDGSVDGQEMANHPNAWLIQLDDRRVLRRLPEQRVFIYDPLAEGASGHGFREIETRDLRVGDQLFVMSAELRAELDEVLSKHGIHLRDDDIFEEQLRAYHQKVQALLDANFPSKTLTSQVRTLREAILKQYPKHTEHYPKHETIRVWINLSACADRRIEELRPFAPAREAYFKAFALTLGMDETQAAVFWSRVIQPFRFARRTGGRKLSDGYATLLLEPEHLMSMAKIARREIETLTSHAREQAFAVEALQKGQRPG